VTASRRGFRGAAGAPGPRLLFLAAVLVPAPAAGQGIPVYDASTMGCSVFRESVRTDIRAQRGGPPYEERGQRTGLLVVRTTADGPLHFTAWYDSLVVWHDAAEGRLVPDTDGLVGGRWEGTLSSNGGVALSTRPFMPPDLRAISDLSDALLDFFPPLAPAAIAPGRSWTDSLGLTITRLADSLAGPTPVPRYQWRIDSRSDPPLEADSTARLRQRATDEGVLAWSPVGGPLGWSRTVTIDTDVSGPGVRLPYRGRVTQHIEVIRITNHPACY
jgi:hypothetical protein